MCEKGFLYVCNREKFIKEAIISVTSLKRFNKEKTCLICTEKVFLTEWEAYFDIVIFNDEIENHTYLSKVLGLNLSPFNKTVFLDSDTFITDSISELFDLLDFVDIATTSEEKLHTTQPFNFKYRNVFPEFNSGVIVYKKNDITKKLFNDWFSICEEYKIINDMPGLREAVLKNFDNLKYSILPQLYNMHGFKTMLILYTKVKIIHERLGYGKGVLTPHFLSFEEMNKFANKINKKHYKRLFIPRIGIISYRWSPENIILFIKKKLGYKRVSKSF
jgi:lipopolysaccharide biosynthesis glycosyltransferase